MSDADTADDYAKFAQLCERLRPQGLLKIEGYGFSAVFDLQRPGAEPRKPIAPVVPARAAAAKKLTDEQLTELAYQEELGR